MLVVIALVHQTLILLALVVSPTAFLIQFKSLFDVSSDLIRAKKKENQSKEITSFLLVFKCLLIKYLNTNKNTNIGTTYILEPK